MPNWCDNSMRLYHEDKTKIDALEAEMSKKNDEGRSMAEPFNHLRPNPSGEWQYDWSCENWGTKWEASIIDWNRDSDNEITIYCDTAWSPPIALYEYLTEQGWQVDALYHESGMAYAGMWNSETGDDYYEYDITDPNFLEELPQDIIDFAGLEDSHHEWMISEMQDQWGDAERTDWISMDMKPERDGWYEVETQYGDWSNVEFAEFADGEWKLYNTENTKRWRGLAEDPNAEWDPVAELDKIEVPE